MGDGHHSEVPGDDFAHGSDPYGLTEGWLSPRMREMLKITAEIEGDQLLRRRLLRE
jgi:hypothetical protein